MRQGNSPPSTSLVQMMTIRPIRFVLLLFGVTLWCTCARPPDPENAAARWVYLLNEHDVAAALDFVSEDVELRLPGRAPFRGRAALRGWLEWDSVVATLRAPHGYRVRADTAFIEGLNVQNHWMRLLGLPVVTHEQGTFLIVSQGRIREMSFSDLDSSSTRALRMRLDDFVPWAQHEYADRLHRIRPDGQFDYQGRRAADWLALLREWLVGDRGRER